MSIVKYDEWVIDLDEEKTKKLYANFPTYTDTATRNYLKVCDDLRNDEWDFFKKFCINPKCCKILAQTKENNFVFYFGKYFVYGNILHYPEQKLITAEEFKRRNFIYDFSDNSIYIRRFKFNIECPHHLINNMPKDMPDGCVCISFMCNQGRP